MNPTGWRDPREVYAEMLMRQQMQQQGQAQQANTSGGGAFGFVGDVVRGTVRPYVQAANTFGQQAGQVFDTGRMLTAQATGNTEAWRNANQSSQNRYDNQKADQGGLFNMGGYFSGEEAQKGDLATGVRRIGGNTAMQLATIAPLGKGATVLARGARAAGVGGAYGAGESLASGGNLEDILTGAGTSAAFGGAIGAGPMNLLRGAGGAAKAGIMGDDVLSGASRAANKSITRKAGQALTGAADDLAVKNFRLSPSQLTNFKKKFGEDAGQTIQKYGFSNADDIATKGIDPLQHQFDQAITGITGVSKESLKKSFEKRIGTLSKAGPSDTKAIGAQLQKEANNLLKGFGDVIDANELNLVRRQFDDLVNYTEKQANPSRYGVNKRMADSIRETLQASDETGTLKGIGRELQKLRQLSDNASKQSQLGRGSLPLNLTTGAGAIAGGAAFGGPVGALATGVGTAAVNSPTGRRAAMKGAGTLGGRLTGTATKQPGRIRPLLARGASIGVANQQPSQSVQPQTLDQALIPGSQPQQQQPQEQSPYSRENLMQDIQRDPENADKYLGYYSTLQEVYAPQESAKPLSQGQQERTDLIQALDNTEGIMGQGSINYGPINSRIEGLKGMFNSADPETLAYKNTVSGLRAAITKARAGASLTAGELKMLQQYTPSDTDSEQVVRSKLQQLRNLYGYDAPTGGGTSLEDVLMSRQQAY